MLGIIITMIVATWQKAYFWNKGKTMKPDWGQMEYTAKKRVNRT